jgi:putative transposase
MDQLPLYPFSHGLSYTSLGSIALPSFGVVKAKLALAERNWTCDGCGALHDRDVNAAINLARLSEHAPGVEGRPAGSGPVAGRGAIRKTSPPTGAAAGGDETSTLHSGQRAAGQTGTAPPQGEDA